MIIKGSNIYLRPTRATDAKHFLQWIQDPNAIKFSLWDFQTPKDKNDFIEYINKSKLEKGRISLMICDSKTDESIGEIGFSSIDLINRRGRTFTLIGDTKYRNKGFGIEAKQLLLEYGFNTLNLNRVYCSVISDNQFWIDSLQKLGFRIEGVEREASFRDGDYRDKIMLGLTKIDWLNKNTINKVKNIENEFFARVENPREVFKKAKELFIVQTIKIVMFTFKHPTEKGVSFRIKTEESGSKTNHFMDLKKKLSEELKCHQYVRSSKEYSVKIDSAEIGLEIAKELKLNEDKNLAKTRYVFYVDKFLIYLDRYTKPDNSWWIEIENANKEEVNVVLTKLNAKCGGI